MLARPDSNDLNYNLEVYYEALAPKVADTTFSSHKCTLEKFRDWWETNQQNDLDETSIAHFVDQLFREYPASTVRGDIDTLANFLGCYLQDDPVIIKNRIAQQLEILARECSHDGLGELAHFIRTPIPKLPFEVLDGLMSYLRQHRYGTREHVFAELIHATNAHPVEVRAIDVSDVHLDADKVEITLRDGLIIREADLLKTRTSSLNEFNVELVDFYTKYNRPKPRKQTNALLTTGIGRASGQTIRRGIKSASESVNKRLLGSGAITPGVQVTPVGLWRYAIHRTFHD